MGKAVKGGVSPLRQGISTPKKRRRWLFAVVPVAVLAALLLLNLFLQTVWAHRAGYFVPDYEQVDLSPVLARETLSREDYDLLFEQTGLARPAVDALLERGADGVAQIIDTQERFFTFTEPICKVLIGGRFTCEDRLVDEDGEAVYSVPMAPLEAGDVLVSFSTHTFGWRHGHAGLVIDPVNCYTLEATAMFSNSSMNYGSHWRTYSNFMVLRVKDADPETRRAVADFALAHLNDIPYRLTSGIFGAKAPDPESSLCAQCAYLPWYAWQAHGVDLDSDGGRIVTVLDLAQSGALEIVQVYGMDPRTAAQLFKK